jgi:hypothetical protein
MFFSPYGFIRGEERSRAYIIIMKICRKITIKTTNRSLYQILANHSYIFRREK